MAKAAEGATTGSYPSQELSHLAAIVRSAEDAIVSTSVDGSIVTWNRSAERLFGWTAEEAIGMSYSRLVPAAAMVDYAERIALVVNHSGSSHFESVRLTKDGQQVIVSVAMSRILAAEGQVLGFSMIIRDVTHARSAEAHLRESEERRRQSQKLEALGQLAGGVAHDFNNLLSVVLTLSEMLLSDLPEDSAGREDVAEIHRAGKRAAKLTEQLLSFSRKQHLQPRVVDLNETLRGTEKMLRRLLREDVRLEVDPAAKHAGVYVDSGYIEQVIMNLALNARDAMPDGGRLSISTSDVVVDDRHAPEFPDIACGEYVGLCVTDSGMGMDESTRARIFEPFFTTKGLGHGTGLGLATVLGIVRQSGGHIHVESEPGRGTTFCIHLPRVAISSNGAATTSGIPAPRSRPGAESILVVEDDSAVRAVVCSILRRAGYEVVDAANAGEAILITEKAPRPFDLLLTDIVMPHASGLELARRLSAGLPKMRVLYMSGYTAEAVAKHDAEEIAIFSKPVTRDALLAKVREVLDQSVAQR